MEGRHYSGDVRVVGIYDDDRGWIAYADVTPEGEMYADLLAASGAFYARLLEMAEMSHGAICRQIARIDEDWRRCTQPMCQDNYAVLAKVGAPPRRCGFRCIIHEGPILDGKCAEARRVLASRTARADSDSASRAS